MTPMDQNLAWQEINKQVGGTIMAGANVAGMSTVVPPIGRVGALAAI
mgnify:CR=1 FL=1